MKKMNKKAKGMLIGILNPTFIYAIIILIIFLLFLKNGGIQIINETTQFLAKLHPIYYILFLIFIIILKFNRRR